MNTEYNARSVVAVMFVCLLLVALLPASTLAAGCEGVTYGAESPEALVEAVQGAASDADMGELARYLSQSDRAKAGVGLTIGATMMLAMQEMGMGMAQGEDGGNDEMAAKKAELAEQQTRLQGILDEYGVEQPSEESMGRMMQQGPDALGELESMMEDVCTVGLIAELADFLSEVSGQKVTDRLQALSSEEVGPITREGDSATATVAGEEFRMNRIDGRWYVDIESTSGGAGPG